MRRRSFTGPLLLLLIGAFFLWRNLHPEAPLFDMAAQYWPFVLIAWGLLRLIEVVALRHRGPTFALAWLTVCTAPFPPAEIPTSSVSA